MVPRLPAARRRRQLLDVALEVFATSGFHQTSMEEVAEAAGVTKPVLYQHFGSKRELYLELLEDVGGQMMAAVDRSGDDKFHNRHHTRCMVVIVSAIATAGR